MAGRQLSEHIIGVRKANGAGWVTGVVHARVRRGKAALELRGTSYSLTLQGALESLGDPRRLNGHGGVSSAFLGATAGLASRDAILRDFLAEPGRVLSQLYQDVRTAAVHRPTPPPSRKEWARRAGVNVSTVRRILNGTQRPSLETARRLLEALQ